MSIRQQNASFYVVYCKSNLPNTVHGYPYVPDKYGKILLDAGKTIVKISGAYREGRQL
ncbi:hypothetical protein CLV42_102460 [Chitinophaga ginsengisoli]|uniref:Uncharacterized protein n=1 Tax=Chitinophaga ginsengisoli TaxID=363837 RepID=A0A2P8GLQ4_9BACT|nr:hypothetical protein CLV42_102460 [Chitinophaga ginsengisoli]